MRETAPCLDDYKNPHVIARCLCITTALLFTLYYTPFIIEAQSIGVSTTGSSAFEGMHKGSVIDFKILLTSLMVLFMRRVYISLK